MKEKFIKMPNLRTALSLCASAVLTSILCNTSALAAPNTAQTNVKAQAKTNAVKTKTAKVKSPPPPPQLNNQQKLVVKLRPTGLCLLHLTA